MSSQVDLVAIDAACHVHLNACTTLVVVSLSGTLGELMPRLCLIPCLMASRLASGWHGRASVMGTLSICSCRRLGAHNFWGGAACRPRSCTQFELDVCCSIYGHRRWRRFTAPLFAVLFPLTNLCAILYFNSRFLRAAHSYGVPEVDLFPANDLWEQKNISGVTQTIFAIGRAVSSLPPPLLTSTQSNTHHSPLFSCLTLTYPQK